MNKHSMNFITHFNLHFCVPCLHFNIITAAVKTCQGKNVFPGSMANYRGMMLRNWYKNLIVRVDFLLGRVLHHLVILCWHCFTRVTSFITRSCNMGKMLFSVLVSIKKSLIYLSCQRFIFLVYFQIIEWFVLV